MGDPGFITTKRPPAPTEVKVKAGARGAGIGAAVAGFVLWLLGRYVFGHDVPEPVAVLVWLIVPAAVAAASSYAAGWLAPHTPRPPIRPRPFRAGGNITS